MLFYSPFILKEEFTMMDLFSELFDMFDGMDMFKAQPSAQQYGKTCPVCGEHPTITELIDYEQAACELK